MTAADAPRAGQRIELYCDSGHQRVTLPVFASWEPEDGLPEHLRAGARWVLDEIYTWPAQGKRDGNGVPSRTGARRSSDPRKRGHRLKANGTHLFMCPRCPREVPMTSESFQFVCQALHVMGVSFASLTLIAGILQRRS